MAWPPTQFMEGSLERLQDLLIRLKAHIYAHGLHHHIVCPSAHSYRSFKPASIVPSATTETKGIAFVLSMLFKVSRAAMQAAVQCHCIKGSIVLNGVIRPADASIQCTACTNAEPDLTESSLLCWAACHSVLWCQQHRVQDVCEDAATWIGSMIEK